MNEVKSSEMPVYNTTLRMPEDLRVALRIEAAVRNTSLHQLILDFLREKVRDGKAAS